ncbi:haloacid dehalogenase-like hydrolase [Polyangium spumosum]|uniref:phosphoserine phosphatase n=1 Tax=Polyangium spumosum TaxID=889282 RepID=A0A6N7PW92_9BACT|nr:haloacid dehalogenase-like hydrolase [Polyangium spumosum]
MFDWDNTVIKNDVGDLVFFWMLKNDKVLQPPNKDWGATSPVLTMQARNALNQACGSLAEAGMPLPTSTNAACADELVSVYTAAETTSGQAAYEGWNYRTMEPAYAWVAELQAGYTLDEVKAFANTAIEAGLAAMEGEKQTVGTNSVNAYVRIYDQIKDLIDVMQKNGLDVWVLSASSQPIVEAFATRVNVSGDHVIGIRTVIDAGGKLTYDFQGCGSVVDGSGNGQNPVGNTMITYIEGKRCWMNKVIYGVSGADAEKPNADPKKRPVFGAGDSDTDISFLHDSTVLKLALNRNKNEIMCNAYANHMGQWLVNPMFIAPNPQKAAPYPCSTTGCKDATGASVACVNEAGEPIPDQMDTVF